MFNAHKISDILESAVVIHINDNIPTAYMSFPSSYSLSQQYQYFIEIILLLSQAEQQVTTALLMILCWEIQCTVATSAYTFNHDMYIILALFSKY